MLTAAGCGFAARRDVAARIDRYASAAAEAPRHLVAATFVAGAAPLFREAATLIARGEYVSPRYGWRSAPRGIDVVAPLLGHPLHPLSRAVSTKAYDAINADRVEAIAWIGIVPLLLLLLAARGGERADGDVRPWRTVAIVFLAWALGPFLTVAGFDTGLKLPELLARFVPLVANARMPGRAMVVVYMALAVLVASGMARAAGGPAWLKRPAMQWLVIGVVAFEYWDAPIPLTPLDRPAVYQALAAAPPGAVCEVPFGIGDGLSVGVGSQDRRVLFYATQHEHPLAGGYIGRMPADAEKQYLGMPITGPLLRAGGVMPRSGSKHGGTNCRAATSSSTAQPARQPNWGTSSACRPSGSRLTNRATCTDQNETILPRGGRPRRYAGCKSRAYDPWTCKS